MGSGAKISKFLGSQNSSDLMDYFFKKNSRAINIVNNYLFAAKLLLLITIIFV
jgi:hypothetical protein